VAHPVKEPNSSLSAISDVGSPNIAGTQIDIYWEPVDRRGRYRAELADGTPLTVSRQPFLDAARALISAGHSPDLMLVGWRKGSIHWSLRGPLGKAAQLTVDETKTSFARWKAFSSSAVATAVGSVEGAATSLATPPENASMDSQDRPTQRRKLSAPSR
jgi:hypothetical protein